MKLLFILTALRFDIRSKIKGELHGLDYLISCLGELLLEATVTSEGAAASTSSGLIEDDQHCLLSVIITIYFIYFIYSYIHCTSKFKENSN